MLCQEALKCMENVKDARIKRITFEKVIELEKYGIPITDKHSGTRFN